MCGFCESTANGISSPIQKVGSFPWAAIVSITIWTSSLEYPNALWQLKSTALERRIMCAQVKLVTKDCFSKIKIMENNVLQIIPGGQKK